MGQIMNVSPGTVLEDFKKLFALIGLVEEGKYATWRSAVEAADTAAALACHLGLWTKDGKGYIQAVRISSMTDAALSRRFVDKHLEETLESPMYHAEREAPGPFKIGFELTRVH